jgi:5-(carboxyamino)imidazole ribonucleotide mutase
MEWYALTLREEQEGIRAKWRFFSFPGYSDEQKHWSARGARRYNEQGELGRRTRRMQPLVGVIMGSRSDWDTLVHTANTLDSLQVPYEVRVVSAHRTPDLLFDYASTAEERGLEVLIAGAGGAAHLPGMTAAKTALPVLGVPVESKALHGVDSLLSIVQMPAGIPVATLAIGRAGAINAALLAASILGGKHPQFRAALHAYRTAQTKNVLDHPDPREGTA